MQIIKRRIFAKLGRSIIGPALPRLALNGTAKSHGLQEKGAQVTCISCGREISMEREMFCYYSGPAKCFSCSATLGIKMASGTLETNAPIRPLFDPPIGRNSQESVISQKNKRTKQSRRLSVEV